MKKSPEKTAAQMLKKIDECEKETAKIALEQIKEADFDNKKIKLTKKLTRLIDKMQASPPKTFKSSLTYATKTLSILFELNKLIKDNEPKPTFQIGGTIHSGEEIIIPKSYEKTN